METELGRVGDLKVAKKTSMGYFLENGMVIEDTFAETCCLIAMRRSVLGQKPSFFYRTLIQFLADI